MDQPAPAYLSVRQPRLGPALLLLCGAVGLYLVAVSHFVVSCLDQIRQAVEATRQSYLPETLHEQQDAVNAERLHRFASVVRYADSPETRRQALLNVQVMALNASSAAALDSRSRLRAAALLVTHLSSLRLRENELRRARSRQVACLSLIREQPPSGTELRQRLDAVLGDDAFSPPPATTGGSALGGSASLPECLGEAERTQQALQSVTAEIETSWAQCDGLLSLAAESIGTSACQSLDSLIGELAEQVRDLQQLVTWLLALTFVVLLVLAYITYRNVVLPILACAQAAVSGDPGQLPEHPHFHEIRQLAEALGAGQAPTEPTDQQRP